MSPREKTLDQIPNLPFAEIVDSAQDAILTETLDGTILSWNQGAQNLYGYTREDVIGKKITMLSPPDTPDEIPGILARLARGETIRHFETKRQRKDGTIIDVSLSISPVLDSNGEVIGVSAIARDITEEKRLLEARHFLASIVDSSDDAILSKDMNGIVLSWNKGAENLYGYTAEEVIGKHVSMLTRRERVDEIESIMETLKRGERIDHYETVRVKKDGTLMDVSLTISPVLDSSGRVIAASAIARDITFRKRIEAERVELLEQISQSLVQKNILLQEVHHRVKNNLQVVASLLELRSRAIQNPESAIAAFHESIDRIRAMSLIHERLYGAPNLQDVNFLIYLRTLAKQLLESYGSTDRVQVHVGGDSCTFELNQAISLGLIFNELISNCLKYAFSKKENGRIDIELKKNGETIKMTLSDNGIGFPDLRTFESSESFGFRIVKLLVRQIKGQIRQLERTEGAAFEIEIPASREDSSAGQ
jgi:PAS domain S-box-containing protein